MPSVQNCINCFAPLRGGRYCGVCGFDQLKPRSSNCLPALTVLNKRYLVGRVLGQGGFGITYLAKDYSLGESG